jgi:hypothetical protein
MGPSFFKRRLVLGVANIELCCALLQLEIIR